MNQNTEKWDEISASLEHSSKNNHHTPFIGDWFNISGLKFTPFLTHNLTLHECEHFMEAKGKHA
jgi:hypothetical protein